MALETGVNFLNDLVETNPVGATDPKSSLDDHLRNVKRAMKATFPGMAGRAWRVQTKTGSYALAVTDNMTQINVTAAATISGTAATLGNGFAVLLYNAHSAAITIPGATLQSGHSILMTCTGSAFNYFPFSIVGPVLLSSQSLTGQSRVTFTNLSGTYSRYRLSANFTLSDDTSLNWRSGSGSEDGGNNYQTAIQTTGIVSGTTIVTTSGGPGPYCYVALSLDKTPTKQFIEMDFQLTGGVRFTGVGSNIVVDSTGAVFYQSTGGIYAFRGKH